MDKTLAVLTINNADKLTKKELKRITAWLAAQSAFVSMLSRNNNDLSKRFRARCIVHGKEG